MLRGAFEGWHIVILAVVILVLFGAKRLPDASRSIGRSLKIFKSEVKELNSSDDDKPVAPGTVHTETTVTSTTPTAPTTTGATAASAAPVVQPVEDRQPVDQHRV